MNDDKKIRTTFQNLRRDTATQVSASDGLDRLHRRNLWWRRAAAPAFGAALIVLVSVGAFALFRTGEDVPPVATTPTTLSSTPTTAPLVPDTGPDGTTPDTTPDRPAGLPAIRVGDVLVAGEESIYSWNGAAATLLLDAPAGIVVDDLFNGIIYTHPDGMWWIPADSYESLPLVADRVDLHTTAWIAGEPTVIYTESVDSAGSDSPVTRVHLLGLYTREDRVVYEFGPMEGGISRISYGGGLLALTIQTDGGVYFELLDEQGRPVDMPNPLPGPSEAFNWADQALLSPDGGTLVYLTGDELRESVGLVAWDMASGTEQARLALDGNDWRYRIWADFDGSTVVVSQLEADGWIEPLRFQLSDGELSPSATVGVAGAPSLVRAPQPTDGPDVSPAACSIGGDFADEPYAELPEPVAAVRTRLIEAALACDFGMLDDLAEASDVFYRYFDQYEPGDFAAAATEDAELMQVLLDLVNQPFGTLEVGEDVGTMYVWPRASTYGWADVTEEDLGYLRRMGLTDREFEGYALFGDYIGYRIGITADGQWLNIAAGD